MYGVWGLQGRMVWGRGRRADTWPDAARRASSPAHSAQAALTSHNHTKHTMSSATAKIITVFGATGSQGGAVVRALAADGAYKVSEGGALLAMLAKPQPT